MFEDKKHEINQLKDQIAQLEKDKAVLGEWGNKKQAEFAEEQKLIDAAREDLGKKTLEFEALKKNAEESVFESNRLIQESVKLSQEAKFQQSEAQRLLAEAVSRTVTAEQKDTALSVLNVEVTRKLNTIREIFTQIDALRKGVFGE